MPTIRLDTGQLVEFSDDMPEEEIEKAIRREVYKETPQEPTLVPPGEIPKEPTPAPPAYSPDPSAFVLPTPSQRPSFLPTRTFPESPPRPEDKPELTWKRAAQQFGRSTTQTLAGVVTALGSMAEREKHAGPIQGIPTTEETLHLREWQRSHFGEITGEMYQKERERYRDVQADKQEAEFNTFAESMPKLLPGSSGFPEEVIKAVGQFLPAMGVMAASAPAGFAFVFAEIYGKKYKQYHDKGYTKNVSPNAASL